MKVKERKIKIEKTRRKKKKSSFSDIHKILKEINY